MFRLPCAAPREVIHFAVQIHRLLLQKEVQIMRREFVAQEVQYFHRLFDLPLMNVQILQGLITPPLGAQNLALDLLDLDGENRDLMVPLIQAPLPAGFGQFQSGGGTGDGRKAIHNAGGNAKDFRQRLTNGKLDVEQRRAAKSSSTSEG